MFYKIENKYYVKMKNYFKELDIKGDNLIPSEKEDSIIYDMSVLATPISYEDILKETSYVVDETTTTLHRRNRRK